ncbi:UPF0193 protein EVG1 [Lampetra fluviatilis]
MAGRGAEGGLWAPAGTAFSPATRDLLRVMMKEARLTNLQQRHLTAKIANGESLPLSSHVPASARRNRKPPPQARSTAASRGRPHLRPASDCMAGDAYEREQYRPKPGKNTEAEKQRLQNLMATGQADEQGGTHRPRQPRTPPPPEPELDRFTELMEEIEERRVFLQEMEVLGRSKQYAPLIHSQISQKIREMEDIDRKRTKELTALVEKDEERNSNHVGRVTVAE